MELGHLLLTYQMASLHINFMDLMREIWMNAWPCSCIVMFEQQRAAGKLLLIICCISFSDWLVVYFYNPTLRKTQCPLTNTYRQPLNIQLRKICHLHWQRICVALVVHWTTRGREIGGTQGRELFSAVCPPGCPGSHAVQPEGGLLLATGFGIALNIPIIHCQKKFMAAFYTCVCHGQLLLFYYRKQESRRTLSKSRNK